MCIILSRNNTLVYTNKPTIYKRERPLHILLGNVEILLDIFLSSLLLVRMGFLG